MTFIDQLALEGDLEKRLHELTILSPTERLIHASERFGWRRGGNESYIAAMDLSVESDTSRIDRPVLLKAIIGYGTTKEKIEGMLARRSLLESAGVGTSHLFAVDDSVFYEGFLPETIEPVSYVKRRDPRTDDLIRYAAALDELGFEPVARAEAFFRDLMADEHGAYVIDFGSDLGEPGSNQTTHGLEALRKVSSRANANFEELETRYESYRDEVNLKTTQR